MAKSNPSIEPNVTRDGKNVLIKRVLISGVKADMIKRQLKIILDVTLDESLLAVRDDLAFWGFDETPLGLELKPSRTQMGMDSLLEGNDNKDLR